MKNKLTLLALALTAITLFTGCGKAAPALKDINVEKYVTLGEYTGLDVTVDPIEVDEEDLEENITKMYVENYPEELFVTDGTIVLGDTANIDYVGKKDNVAFSGGTAEDYNLTIGSGTFIDGFEDGLVGAKAGTTIELPLTFPKTYHNADLAGQAVIFTVTVNYIIPGEMTDENVTALNIDGVTTADELRQHVYDTMYEEARQKSHSNAAYDILEIVLDNCNFKTLPKKVIGKYEDEVKADLKSTAEAFGVDINTLCYYFYQMDLDTFVAFYSEQNAQESVAIQAIANKEGLNISDEELDTMLLEKAEAAGHTTIEEYIGKTSKEDYREKYVREAVINFLIENVAAQ